jgi:MFS family permease
LVALLRFLAQCLIESPHPLSAGETAQVANDTESPQNAWRGAFLNGALWALGNGLVSTSLVTYLAKEYGATSGQVGWILACPHLFGVLRLAAPLWLDLDPNRRRLSLLLLLASGLVLLALPMLSWPQVLATPQASLTALIACWTAWHVLMYLGLVPLFSWFGDLAERDELSQRLGQREAWMTAATIVGTLAAAAFTQWWNSTHSKQEQWQGLALAALAGSAFVLLSVAPLGTMPHAPRRRASRHASLTEFWHALVDRRFLPLLLFNVTFSFANGLTAATVALFPYVELKIGAPTILALQSFMRVGQVMTAPAASSALKGRLARLAMVLAEIIVAVGLLFYLPATANAWWWIIGAWTCWIAYVVLNIGLPSLTLQLSPGKNSPAYVATIMAASGLSFGASSVLGGWLLDMLRQPADASFPLDAFRTLVLAGFVLRLASAGWLFALPDVLVNKTNATEPQKAKNA